ncbi:MAG: hypothetical protein R2860_11255 [Desulfobacterales bacterium]
MTIGFFRNAGQDTALALMRTSLSALGLNVAATDRQRSRQKKDSAFLLRETRFAVKEDFAGAVMMDLAIKTC